MKRSVVLRIDTSVVRSARIEIVEGTKILATNVATGEGRAQALLPLIAEELTAHSLIVSDITGIDVAVGPGSYTGLRVGIAVANTLGRLLDVPVNGKSALATPTYS